MSKGTQSTSEAGAEGQAGCVSVPGIKNGTSAEFV